jgi:hypothetical protein
MDEVSKQILSVVGIGFDNISELNGYIIPREELISVKKYESVKPLIPGLKKIFSSSCMTSLQSTAAKEQSWPLLNLVRQILNVYKYNMKPIRKSDGYTKDGVKKYKRFFEIYLRPVVNNNTTQNKSEEKVEYGVIEEEIILNKST